MLWGYIREKVRQAFLAGINDGLAELDGAAPDGIAGAAGQLRLRLEPALPPPAGEEGPAPARRRKG